jgi:branched-chain amino acid transport system permease protein
MAMLGGYVGIWVLSLTSDNIGIAVVAVVVLMFTLGVVLERFLFRRFETANHLIPLLVSLALALALQEAARNLINHGLPLPYPLALQSATNISVWQLTINGVQIIEIVATVLLVGLLNLLLYRTGFGLQIRAVADNRDIARILAINPNRVGMIVFAVATAIAAIAGVLYGVAYNAISPELGALLSFKALAAALLGGLGRISGAIIGGLTLGLVETLGSGYISSAFSDAIAFGVIILVLRIRPGGILSSVTR